MALQLTVFVGALYVFLVGVNGLGHGFELMGGGALDSFFAATSNPFLALLIGILATSIVQSSSVTTSLVVALAAAPDNPLPLESAVPMIIGANFGTTVTNTVVSLAHITDRKAFGRAFAVSTVDDFFNLWTAAIVLPLEIATGFLRRTATLLTDQLGGFDGIAYESPIRAALEFALAPIVGALQLVSTRPSTVGGLLVLTSAFLIFTSLTLLVRTLRDAVRDRVQRMVERALARNALLAMLVGLLATVMVQSSSITLSLLVPLAGAGLLSLRRAYPVVLGANLGTTVTALLAAVGTTGVNARAGMTIAFVHMLFNLVGILLFFPIRRLRVVPQRGSRWIASIALRSPLWAIAWVVVLFYGIPASLALLCGRP